ncbi:MAG: hypothetical protein AMS17_01240 [Spirochaetes bacterium DG_61]|nr:MAG: hypothetical protein AMS17_01240 [Spirochaetes bacterium DG_61]
MMKAYIISIGDELTKGEIVNSNAAYIARELTECGISVAAIFSLPDREKDAALFVNAMLKNSGLFLFTGGLGATRDDLTRRIISAALKKRLVVDGECIRILEKWYAKKGRPFTESDRMQASYPEGGRLLRNPIGLAFGFYVSSDERHIFSLPGVPKEMEYMFSEEVLPKIRKDFADNGHYHTETLLFSDIPEYTLDHRLGEIISHHRGVRYGTRSSDGLIRVRVDSRVGEVEPCIRDCIHSLGDYYICRGGFNLEGVVGELLMQRDLVLSVAESCTAGYLSKIITDVPGSSRYFSGGVVSYSNDVKIGVLGVSQETLRHFGAVSSETAVQMAKGVKERFSSDISLSITGIAGPDGGSKEKPVGTVYICLYRNEHEFEVQKQYFPGDREGIRKRSVNRALFLLFKYLKGLDRS